jgi:hypothetical protein
MAHEFEELSLDGHNYPIWTMDVKISSALIGMYEAIIPTADRQHELPPTHKYNALYIIKHHIHPDLKSEYVLEEETSDLWMAFQNHYEQQKAVILPEANQDWIRFHLQDYKSIGDYNHVVRKICAKLWFCEKEPSDEDKIEKNLTTMLPSDRVLKHQYRARNHQRYSELIHDLLQTENHDKLTMRNHHQRPVGTAPLLEVNYSSKGKEKTDGAKPSKNVDKFKRSKKNKNKKTKSKDHSLGKRKKSFKCHHCDGANHIVEKCKIPQQLVDLYQKSLKEAGKAKGSYETHFNAASDEVTTSSMRPMKLQNQVQRPTTTLMGRTWSLSTIQTICLETKNRLHLSY